jgi:hypothetical protein
VKIELFGGLEKDVGRGSKIVGHLLKKIVRDRTVIDRLAPTSSVSVLLVPLR